MGRGKKRGRAWWFRKERMGRILRREKTGSEKGSPQMGQCSECHKGGDKWWGNQKIRSWKDDFLISFLLNKIKSITHAASGTAIQGRHTLVTMQMVSGAHRIGSKFWLYNLIALHPSKFGLISLYLHQISHIRNYNRKV